jgi:peroxiredoxin
MKLLFSLFFILIAGLSFAQSTFHAETKEEMDSLLCPTGYAAIGHPYPEFKITNENKAVDNRSLHGKVVFINFWFEGCHPCMAEMEALNELFEKVKSNKDFEFISLTWDNQETIKRVKEKFALNFNIFSASEKECQRLNFGCGYPTSIILDKDGNVKNKHSGGSVKKEDARKFVMNTLLPEIQSLF